MDLDVLGDGGREQAGARVSGLETAPEFGGGDVLVDGAEDMDAGALGGGEGKRCELGFGQGEFRAANDDPLCEFEQTIGRAPASHGEEAVCAGDGEEVHLGHSVEKFGQGVNCVVWRAVGLRGVETGDDKAGVCRENSRE